MRKIVKLLVIVFIFLLFSGCTNNVIKSEYKIKEEAFIDDIYITLDSASWLENNNLELVFRIYNKSKRTLTIDPDTNFKIYNENNQIKNINNSNQDIINSGKEVYYKLIYNGIEEQTIYDILFYSGIVENNIKFSLNKSDIN